MLETHSNTTKAHDVSHTLVAAAFHQLLLFGDKIKVLSIEEGRRQRRLSLSKAHRMARGSLRLRWGEGELKLCQEGHWAALGATWLGI